MEEELRQLVIDVVIQRYVKRNVDPVLPTPATGRDWHRRLGRHRGTDGVGRFRGGRRQRGRQSRCDCRLCYTSDAPKLNSTWPIIQIKYKERGDLQICGGSRR